MFLGLDCGPLGGVARRPQLKHFIFMAEVPASITSTIAAGRRQARDALAPPSATYTEEQWRARQYAREAAERSPHW